MHANSLALMEDFRDRYLADMEECSVLDVGARRIRRQRTYRPLFKAYHYVGMDIVPGKNVDIVGYEKLSGPYDVLISGQVMEHVRRPWEWLKRLTDYFTSYICIIAPNTSKLHRFPLDTYRYWPDGMVDLFDFAGIRVLEARAVGTDTIGIGRHDRTSL